MCNLFDVGSNLGRRSMRDGETVTSFISFLSVGVTDRGKIEILVLKEHPELMMDWY